jgi:hypothetical protein
MAITTERIDELAGQFGVVVVGPYALVEGSVAAQATVPLVGAVGGEGPYTAPWPGRILAISGGAEASASFTLKPTINGAEIDDGEVSVAAAAFYGVPAPTANLVFAAGDTLGIEVGTDTTSKDMMAYLHVLYDFMG